MIFWNFIEEYYQFLDGDIYEEACYYQCQFSNELIETFHLDTSRLYFKKGGLSVLQIVCRKKKSWFNLWLHPGNCF